MLREVGRKATFYMLKYVKNNCKGGKNMDNTRRIYLDNIRWITVCIVVIYHVIYMYNGVQLFGVIGPFKEQQLQDAFQYFVYPWMMALLFTVSGMTVRYYMEKHNLKEFIRDKTRKLLVPSTVGLFVFQWILGYYNMKISGAFESFESVPGIVRYVIMAISGIGVLWYIQVLWIFSMLLLLVRKFERDRIWKKGEKTLPISGKSSQNLFDKLPQITPRNYRNELNQLFQQLSALTSSLSTDNLFVTSADRELITRYSDEVLKKLRNVEIEEEKLQFNLQQYAGANQKKV